MNLYRRNTLPASLALLLACLVGFTAVTAQRRKPHPLRATALVELTTDAAGVITARLIPITILDEGRFYDASIYKATPQPMAIVTGVVYEAQKSGEPVGYVTVGNATKDGAWMAPGKWEPVKAAAPSEAPVAPTVNAGDDRPILRRGDSTSAAKATPTPTQIPPNPVPQTPVAPPSPAATPTATPEPPDPNRPSLRHSPGGGQQQAVNQPQPQPGKPAPAPQGAVPSPKLPVTTQTLVAVSDTQAGESRSFQFVWKKGEQAEMEAKMRRLALAQFPHDNAKTQLTDHSLANVVIRALDLDLSNDAVLVLTAELPGSSNTTQATKIAPDKSPSRYIALIARVDVDGNLQRLLASLTDSSRLDVAPRLELIDAVDVDGEGRGELLFRQTSFDQKSFVIYSVGRSIVTKLFEGASAPLR